MESRGEAPRTNRPLTLFGRVSKGAVATSVIAGSLIVGGATTMVTVSAHVPSASLACDTAGPILNVNLVKYTSSVTNTVVVTVDGVVADSNANFGTTFIKTYHINTTNAPFVAHTAEVNVHAGDDPTGSHGWTKDIKLTAARCVAPASPTISTLPSTAGPIGAAIHDSATVHGGNAPTGNVVFKLFGPQANPSSPVCTTAIFTSTAPLVSGNAVSGAFSGVTVAGTYAWTAAYSGDVRNNSAFSGCTAELTTVGKAGLAISTTPSAGGVVPVAVSDSATITGGHAPTGSVVFKLYGPTSATAPDCTTTPIFTSTVPLAGKTTVASGSHSVTAAGTYAWTAEYSGDANNKGAKSGCADELVTTTSPGGVGGITTPNTGGDSAAGKLTVGGFLLLSGIGVALMGVIVPRRRRNAA
jgi:hypothetical protein